MKTQLVATCALLLCAATAFAQDAGRESELEQARQQLEDAARRIAELTGGGVDFELALPGRGAWTPPRAVLGVGIEDDDQGVRVIGVTPGGGADAAGVQTGDIISAMDGASLSAGEGRSPAEVLVAQMRNVDPGDTVALTILRNGQPIEVEVEARPAMPQMFGFRARPGGPPGPATRDARPFDFTMPMRRWADMELVELSPGLGAYFGTETGVLVVRAPSDAMLGLQDGDVILEIGGRTPMGVGHALRILGSFEPGEELELTIMREQRRRTLEVELPTTRNGD